MAMILGVTDFRIKTWKVFVKNEDDDISIVTLNFSNIQYSKARFEPHVRFRLQ